MMNLSLSKLYLICTLIFFLFRYGVTQTAVDPFKTKEDWKIITADQVEVITSIASGKVSTCLQMDIHFKAGTGYGGVQKKMTATLPENFQFSFYIKGEFPVSNLEFKLIDATGDNVWWYNQRNFDFPREWKKVTVKKRNIEFAWGPTTDRAMKQIDKIEIMIASVNGGKGTILLDEFKFEPLESPVANPPLPVFKASSQVNKKLTIKNVMDGDIHTYWQSAGESEDQEILIDCRQYREFGGLVIDWDAVDFARQYEVFVSNDQKDWDLAYRVTAGAGGRRYIYLRDFDSRYIKLNLQKSSRSQGYKIGEVTIRDYEFARNRENFFSVIAAYQQQGFSPRYLLGEQSYWTITGPPEDDHEALINEDGQVEVDRRSFSIEPFIYMNNKLYTWNDSKNSQYLEKDYLPVPSVQREGDGLICEIKIFSSKDEQGSLLYLIYNLHNITTDKVREGNLYLALRPFQVNPSWQFLSNPGGTARVSSIFKKQGFIEVNGEKKVIPLTRPVDFGAVEFDGGEIIEFLKKDELPADTIITDHFEAASAAWRYPFQLQSGQSMRVILAVPWTEGQGLAELTEADVDGKLEQVLSYWEQKVNTVQFNLPTNCSRFINTIRSNLAYILINRDGMGIQPGSRSYERSWIRDGSLTSSALLKMGITEEVKDFIEWYADHQFENGKVPCVVDRRGPDPVPENDSHGQLIFAIFQYYQFTGDREFLERNFEHVRKAVQYMEWLSAQRRTPEYEHGNPIQQACYGLLPESISHEGYSAKPMHSYWDDFFAIKGYKDAVEIARILGKDELVTEWSSYRDRFSTDLYRSLNQTMKIHQIDYIPGCVELGDFDATSTTIAINPCNELLNLPKPQVYHTFDRYFDYFQKRRNPDFNWKDYTPYENRLIGSFVYLDQIERAHELVDFFFNDQRPAAWNHWAEVVRKEYRTPGFIGDMPHTWVGSDFINAARAMFVYEDESNQSLVLGAGILPEWVDEKEGMSVRNLPTYYGEISYSIKKVMEGYEVLIEGNLTLPEGKIILKNFSNKQPRKVLINEREINILNARDIMVPEFPARIKVLF